LHGLSLNQANKIVKKFIIESFEGGYKKLLIITGKGLRSKVHKNPYLSEQMNVLKYSVPEFIKNDEDLFEKISRISTADLKDGGEGAFYIFFKKVKKSIE
jgi:DNA-nicking Smr family endonuclease